MTAKPHVDFSILYLLCWLVLSGILWAVIITATWEVLHIV